MGRVIVEIEIQAPPEDVYELAKKSEHFSRFMPDVRSVKVIEEEIDYKIAKWVADNDGIELSWLERDSYDDEKRVITFEQLLGSGDFEKYQGRWDFYPTEDGGTRTRLEVIVDFGLPELEGLMGKTIDLKVRDDGSKMLVALKAEAEKICQLNKNS